MRREDWHASKVTASAVRPRELRTAEDNSKGTRAAVPIPGRRRQVEGYEFKDRLVYVVGFRTARTVERPCLKHQKPKTNNNKKKKPDNRARTMTQTLEAKIKPKKTNKCIHTYWVI